MRRIMTVLAILGLTAVSHAECMPEKMVKVVVRDATPGVDPDSFAAKPRTLYRLGSKYGRLEEALDATRGIHGLLVASEPDIWMINLVDRKGRHIVDTGEPYHFHAPLVGSPGDPKAILELEFGCEVPYMKALTTGPPKRETLDGLEVDRYEATVDKYRMVLSVSPQNERPVAFTLYEGERLSYDMRYVEYAIDLEPQMGLFERPEGIEYTEEK